MRRGGDRAENFQRDGEWRVTARCRRNGEHLVRIRDGKQQTIAPARFVPLVDEP